MIPTEWLGHRRASDGELVGYLVPGAGPTFTPVSLFGLPVDGPMDLDDAERRLEEIGLSGLAERWLLDRPGHPDPIPVRIVEAGPSAVTVTSVGTEGPVPYGTRIVLDVPTRALRPG